jgi:hypothetical protein
MYQISCVLMATIAYWCGGHVIIELTRDVAVRRTPLYT